MRKFIKDNILEIYYTMYEAHKMIKKFLREGNIEKAKSLLCNCQESAFQIGKIIENSEKDAVKIIAFINEYCKYVYEIFMTLSDKSSGKEIRDNLDKKLYKCEKSVKDDIKVKIEIVFLPYKASMWDSLESIWMAASKDENVNAYVIPIPYYDRNPDRSFGKCHYEGNEFPDYVPITHYNKYNFETCKPDVIYIHNPYDDCNYVTSVDPRFYSQRLKIYTDCLVFVPYFIAGYFNDPNNYWICQSIGIRNSDIVVLQSKVLKEIYINNGNDKEKIFTLGSPKIDKAISNMVEDYPEKWMRLKRRKICLINMGLASYLEWDNFIEILINIIDCLINENHYSVLLRPHPLFESTIKSMRSDKFREYEQFCQWFSSQEYCLRDDTADSIYAINFADILISDYSSLIFSFIPTEKPVIQIINGMSPISDTTIFACDTRNIYYYNCTEEGTGNLADLVDTVLANDYMKEQRMNAFRNSIINSDGTCGIKVHKSIMNYVRKHKNGK